MLDILFNSDLEDNLTREEIQIPEQLIKDYELLHEKINQVLTKIHTRKNSKKK